jgi:hypothetical protein
LFYPTLTLPRGGDWILLFFVWSVSAVDSDRVALAIQSTVNHQHHDH